jgi:hypothetical protein
MHETSTFITIVNIKKENKRKLLNIEENVHKTDEKEIFN